MCFSAWCDNCNSYFSFDNDDVTKLIIDPVKKKVFAYCPKCKQKSKVFYGKNYLIRKYKEQNKTITI